MYGESDFYGVNDDFFVQDSIKYYSPRSTSTLEKETSESKQKEKFEKYTSKPFSFAWNKCFTDTNEQIFKEFVEWLLSQNENFLYTFEPKPTLAHATLGKCPYMHTELTCEEKLQMIKRLEEQDRMKVKIDNFLRKRLRLINRLINVYQTAKRGIENEYHKDALKKDPYCEVKRRQATKRIVDMMVKQFALEYLYLKCMKIENEMEEINCILIETERVRHLKNIYKYTMRTAEKLRCILEIECSDEQDKKTTFFDEKTLRDMARMYLNEVDNFAKLTDIIPAEPWGSEHLPLGLIGEGIPEYDVFSNILLNDQTIQDDTSMVKDSQTTTETQEQEDESSLRDGDVSSADKQSADENKTLEDEDNEAINIDDVQKEIVQGEESQNIIQEIKREILKSDYTIEAEVSETSEEKDYDFDIADFSDDQQFSDDIEMKQKIEELERSGVQAELFEQFKRELWLVEAFHYYTMQLRPDIAGKFKLIHKKKMFESDMELLEEVESSHLDLNTSESTDPCLIYLNKLRHPSITEDIESVESPIYSPSKCVSFSLAPDQPEISPTYKNTYKQPQNMLITLQQHGQSFITWKPDKTISNLSLSVKQESLIREFEETKFSINDTDRNNGYGDKVEDDNFPSPIFANEANDLANIVLPEDFDIEDVKQITNIIENDEPLGSRQGSIPSFSGSIYDPWKKYRKCAEMRQIRELAGREESTVDASIDGIVEEENSSESSASESIKDLILTTAGNHIDSELVEGSNTSLFQIQIGESESASFAEASMKSVGTEKSKCFPTLMDVMEQFTKQLKSKSDSQEDLTSEESTIEKKEGDEPLLEKLLDVKWEYMEKKRNVQHLECDFDISDLIQQLGKANKQYMNQHPEMTAIINLILRRFSLKMPQNGFVKFIRDTVHDKHFAKQLSAYLSVHNSGYRRMKGMKHDKYSGGDDRSRMFSFDKSSSDYWKDWGVDYEKTVIDMQEEYDVQCDSTLYTNQARHTQNEKDPWDFNDIFESKNKRKTKTKENEDFKTGWVKYSKSLKEETMKKLKKEGACINALKETVPWEPPPDPRSSCQKLHPPVCKYKHKQNLNK